MLDDLCRSFLDLLRHFDPQGATMVAVPPAPVPPRLPPYDGDTVRQHLVALRSLAGAIEGLEVDTKEEEIDRTFLLDFLRSLTFRYSHQRPHVRNPAFWAQRLCQALEAYGRGQGPARTELLTEIPDYVAAALRTLESPPVFLVDAARGLLDRATALLLDTPDAADSVEPLLHRDALEALERFRLALRHEIAPDSDPTACGIGGEEVDRLLHYAHAVQAGGRGTLRRLARITEALEPEVVAAAEALEPGAPWREVVSKAGGPGGQGGPGGSEGLERALRAELARARDFVESQELFLLPASLSQAVPAVRTPAALGTALRETPSPVAPAAAAVLAVHHGVPGRGLLLAAREGLRSTVRRELASAAAVAGWGLYAEEVMLEHGFFDPAQRLLQRARLYRLALVGVVDLSVHLRLLSPSDAIERLHAAAPMTTAGAHEELLRICLTPLEPAATLLMREDLLALREAWRATPGKGGRSPHPLAGFHATVLAYAAMPPTLARWGMGVDG